MPSLPLSTLASQHGHHVHQSLSRRTISSLLGYSSLGFWIIAQAPQLLENYRLQSCEGLALPFLINWLSGDVSNLLGCILTDQREFQTLLAAYFCLIDLALTGQYFYYSRKASRRRHHHHHHRSSYRALDEEPQQQADHQDALSIISSASSSSRSSSPQPHDSPVQYLPGLPLVSAHEHGTSAMSDLAESISDLARAVTRSQSRRRDTSSRPASQHRRRGAGVRLGTDDSSASVSASHSPVLATDDRGRAMHRRAANIDEDDEEQQQVAVEGRERKTAAAAATTTTFFAVWMLVGLRAPATPAATTGSLLAAPVPSRIDPRHVSDYHLLIGRVSAWISTTLYLTSRLPQIWKNWTRKSCEGLSVLLFLFAFMGNVTYVASILINPAGDGPPEDASRNLVEALPYLLGSGGTTIFDLIIMLQSYAYRDLAPQDAADKSSEEAPLVEG